MRWVFFDGVIKVLIGAGKRDCVWECCGMPVCAVVFVCFGYFRMKIMKLSSSQMFVNFFQKKIVANE